MGSADYEIGRIIFRQNNLNHSVICFANYQSRCSWVADAKRGLRNESNERRERQ